MEQGLLAFYPAAALSALRSPEPLLNLTGQLMKPGLHTVYAGREDGTAIDIEASFFWPGRSTIPATGQVGLAVLGAADGSELTKIYFDPDFVPYLAHMANTVFSDDVIQGNSTVFHRSPAASASACKAVCEAASRCVAWVHHTATESCELKDAILWNRSFAENVNASAGVVQRPVPRGTAEELIAGAT